MTAPTLAHAQRQFSSERFELAIEDWDTDHGRVRRPIIHHPGAVAVIALPTPDHIVMVRQFRYPIRRWTLEIPAGTRAPGEAPEATAARELQEESGWSCAHLVELIRVHPAVGVSDEELIVYRASGLSSGSAAPELGELVSSEVVPLASLVAMAHAGEMCDAKTLIALALLGQRLRKAA